MQPSRILLLAGAVTAGAISLAGLAYAGDSGLKTLSLQLPGGSVTQIEYSGPVQPQVQMLPSAAPGAVAMPAAFMNGPAGLTPANPFAVPADPFAQLNRISAMMDQQAAVMMQALQVVTLPHLPGTSGMMPASFGPLPMAGGSASYSFVSISSGVGGGCMQSLQITSGAPGQAPQIVQHSAGACGGAKPGMTPAVQRMVPPPATATPHLIPARDVHPIAVPEASQT